MRHCEACGQPLPEAARRDPPLPPLDHPNVVTIHDLPKRARAKAKVKVEGLNKIRHLVLPASAEGGEG